LADHSGVRVVHSSEGNRAAQNVGEYLPGTLCVFFGRERDLPLDHQLAIDAANNRKNPEFIEYGHDTPQHVDVFTPPVVLSTILAQSLIDDSEAKPAVGR
jgi:hypothetical protein